MGWVGFGISDNGGMKGADIAILQKDSNGAFFVEDHFATGYFQPNLDKIQNVALLNASQGNGITTFTFKRFLNSCDKDEVPFRILSPITSGL